MNMKVLMISSDRNILKEGSPVRERMIDYGGLVEEMHIIVFSLKKLNFQFSSAAADNFQTNSKFKISNNVFVYQTNSKSKWLYIFDAYKIAKKILVAGGQWLATSQDPFETGLAGWLLKRKFKTPLQLQIHTDFLSPYFRRESFLNKIRVLIAKFLIPRADCVRVVSKRIKDSLDLRFKIKDLRIFNLSIFVDVKKIQEAPITIDLRKKYPQFDFIILMASRLTKEKNIGLAIEVLRDTNLRMHANDTNNANKKNIGLIIVGGGPERKNLELLVTRCSLQNNVILEKAIPFEQLISYYKTADLFLLTSNYEGYGMAAVEAMAAGCPVVMTDVGLAGEVLINKKNGLVTEVGSREKITAAVLELIENPELRKHLADSARKIVDSWPTKEEYLKNYFPVIF